MRTIVITGASSGFGRLTAEALARKGHRVIATMREANGRNRAHADALRAQSIDVFELDVAEDASVERAARAILKIAPDVDVVVNNAGVFYAGITEAFTPDQAKVVFNTNVVGVFRTTRAFLPAMRRRGQGLIVNVGSIVGRVTFPFFGLYGASKFALEALTDSLRYELSQSGVEVALVQPSAYPTPLFGKTQQPADMERAAEYGPVAEIPGAMFRQFQAMFGSANAPDPADVAEAIAKLVDAPKGSRAARTVVGAAFGADVVNRATAAVQADVIRGLGLGHLEAAQEGSRKAA